MQCCVGFGLALGVGGRHHDFVHLVLRYSRTRGVLPSLFGLRCVVKDDGRAFAMLDSLRWWKRLRCSWELLLY